MALCVFVNIVYDFFQVIGLEPSGFQVAFEPSELFPHVLPRVRLYLPNGFFQREQAIEIKKGFFVAHGVEGIAFTIGINTLAFVNQTVVEHGRDTCVDSFIKLASVSIESYLQYLERSFFVLLCTERRIGLSRHVAYFKCMYHATGVLSVYNMIVFGV